MKKTQEISNTVDTENNEITVAKNSPISEGKSNVSASSQQQLIKLAKGYSLEGGMLPEEKQKPILDRAAKRERIIILKQQQNLESIIHKAVNYCDNENIVNKTDQDWFSHFIKLAENISNPVMQDLWAKILAGEIFQPGSFSLKALTEFKKMSIHDAKLLAKACSLSCHDTKKQHYRIITGSTQQSNLWNIFDKDKQQNINLNTVGLSYGDILSLSENHLVFSQESESHLLKKGESIDMNFNGIMLSINAKKNDCALRFYKFTPIGVELARLINDVPEMAYLQRLKIDINSHFSIQTQGE